MNQREQHLYLLLGKLELVLRHCKHWSESVQSRQALVSTEQFSIDTLNLPQWLQFVFIPKLQQLQ